MENVQVGQTGFTYFAQHNQRLLLPGELLQTASATFPGLAKHLSSVFLGEGGGCFGLFCHPHLSIVHER